MKSTWCKSWTCCTAMSCLRVGIPCHSRATTIGGDRQQESTFRHVLRLAHRAASAPERAPTRRTSAGSARTSGKRERGRSRPTWSWRRRAALTGYFLEGGVRDLAVLGRAAVRGSLPPAPRRQGPAARRRHRLLRAAPEPALQLRALRHAWADRDAGIRHVHRKVFLPDLRCVRRGALRRGGPERAGIRHPLGTRRDPDLRGRLALVHPDARGARRRPAHHRPEREPGPRHRYPGEDGAGRPASLGRWSGSSRTSPVSTACSWLCHNWSASRAARRSPAARIVADPARRGCVAEGPIFEEALVPATPRLRGDHPGPAGSAAAGRPGDAAAAPAGIAACARGGRRGGPTDRRTDGPWQLRRPDRGRKRARRSHRRAVRGRPLRPCHRSADPLEIDPALTRRWLVEFLRDEVQRRRGFEKVVIGLSGGVDSSLVAYLAAEALGAGERDRGADAVPHLESREPGARAAGDRRARDRERGRWTSPRRWTGSPPPSAADIEPGRLGNIMARARMITLFDLSAAAPGPALSAPATRPSGCFGYFTWHADDSPPVNPIGDLFKTQVWALARHLGVPEVIVAKPASADLIHGTDRRGRLRHLLPPGRRDPPLDSARLSGRGDRAPSASPRTRSPWCAGGSTPPTGSAGCRPWRC